MELLSGVNPAAANDALGTSLRLFDHGVAKNGPISNRGKKKELSLDDVGGSVFRASAGLGMSGGAKGKRSERDRDSSKHGRLSMGGAKGERKTKSKLKQKTAQLSMSGVNKIAETGSEAANNSGNRRKDVRFMSSGNAPPGSSRDAKDSLADVSTLPLDNIDGIEELGVDCDTDAPQDLNSWFNFEVDGEEHDDVVGLEIPMDDLSDLLIF
ncbi:uncharacterized protein LOC125212167 [Salvia hispanica]|uniref:uncharacterized protein LOC125212167 n=1 Tax=Salvia hispanica TaxID=49212 RepID=UPI002009476F|nr:uncharacterized protein LOC125212167 [Salvia hispanica]